MYKPWIRRGCFVLVCLLSVACFNEPAPAANSDEGPLSQEPFKNHWFDGKAELSRYELKQSRYGDERTGDAVLIFVTEDFDPEKQVKVEQPDKDSTPVLKLNFTKNFLTGIYPYSIMTSSFLNLENSKVLKVTTSVQEWCGQTFLQVNHRDNTYAAQGFSYFESEGDVAESWQEGIPEEEIWSRLRIDPNQVPTGKFKALPSGEAIRLNHLALKPVTAEAVLTEAEDHYEYNLRYRDLGRVLSIRIQKQFPHHIEGWTETVRGDVTQATRTHSIRLPYWQHNDPDGKELRPQLGLTP